MPARLAGRAKERQVIGLGGAPGVDNFAGIRPQPRCRVFAGIFQGPAGAPAGPMSTCRVAVGIDEEGPHGFPDGREKRSGGVVIEIDFVHGPAPMQGKGGRRRIALLGGGGILPATSSLYRPPQTYCGPSCRSWAGCNCCGCTLVLRTTKK